MITYAPEDANTQLWPEGEYDAELLGCEEKTSKQDNPMYELSWRVFDANGNTMQLRSWIAFPKMTFMLKRLAQALNKLKEFEKSKFDPCKYVGASIRLKLRHSKPVGDLEPRSEIAMYLPVADKKAAGKNGEFAPDDAVPADQVPF